MKILFFLLLVLNISLQPLSLTAPSDKKESEKSALFLAAKSTQKLITTILVLATVTELIITIANQDTKNKMLEQLNPKNLVVTFLKEYTTQATVTLFHELGHAIATYLITGQQADIHLGSYEETMPITTLGRIKIDGLNPAIGKTTNTSRIEQCIKNNIKTIAHYCTIHCIDPTSLTENRLIEIIEKAGIDSHLRLKEACILLAGGCTAIISHYLIKLLLTLCFNKKINSLASILTIDHILIEQLMTMLWPMQLNTILSDGGKLWKTSLGASKKTIETTSSYADSVIFASELALAYKNAKGHQQNAIDLMLIAILNKQLHGYLHFSL